jgi:copper(I)-binding protein
MMKPLQTTLFGMTLLGAACTTFAQIKVENAWVRATVPTQQATGAFMKMRAVPKGLGMPANTPVELKSGGAVPIALQFTHTKDSKQTVLVNAKASLTSPYKP